MFWGNATSPSHSQAILPNPGLLILERIERAEQQFRLFVRMSQRPACPLCGRTSGSRHRAMAGASRISLGKVCRFSFGSPLIATAVRMLSVRGRSSVSGCRMSHASTLARRIGSAKLFGWSAMLPVGCHESVCSPGWRLRSATILAASIPVRNLGVDDLGLAERSGLWHDPGQLGSSSRSGSVARPLERELLGMAEESSRGHNDCPGSMWALCRGGDARGACGSASSRSIPSHFEFVIDSGTGARRAKLETWSCRQSWRRRLPGRRTPQRRNNRRTLRHHQRSNNNPANAGWSAINRSSICAGQGCSQKAISQKLGIERKTIHRWLRTGQFPERKAPHCRPDATPPSVSIANSAQRDSSRCRPPGNGGNDSANNSSQLESGRASQRRQPEGEWFNARLTVVDPSGQAGLQFVSAPWPECESTDGLASIPGVILGF